MCKHSVACFRLGLCIEDGCVDHVPVVDELSLVLDDLFLRHHQSRWPVAGQAHGLVLAVDLAGGFVKLGILCTDVEPHVRDTLGLELTAKTLISRIAQELERPIGVVADPVIEVGAGVSTASSK